MSDLSPVYFLVYTSTASEPFDDGRLLDLLRTCRVRNEQCGVTGALMYRNGVFVQLLEGSEATVESLREKIYRDPRHTGILTLIRGVADARIFGEWTMHFVAADERTAREREINYRCLRGADDVEAMLESSGNYSAPTGSSGLHPGLRLLLMLRQIM